MTQGVEQVKYVELSKPRWVAEYQWWMYVVTDPRDYPISDISKVPMRVREIQNEYTAIFETADGKVMKISLGDLLYTWRWVYLGSKEIPNQE